MVKNREKLRRQMLNRGWTDAQIEEAIARGLRYEARNHGTGGPATRFVHPETGRSVVIDDLSGEVLHVGGDDFRY